MKPDYDALQRPQIRDHQRVRPGSERPQAEALVSLSEEQRRLLAVLQSQRNGMTVHQIQITLSWPNEGVQPLLETLLERQLVARLNTIVPSYIYRYGGIDLDAD